MATINITGEQFNETVRGEGITLVDFWASWCAASSSSSFTRY